VLFRRRSLDGIRAGEITLAFRRWDRQRARAGGRQRTVVGELAIDSVEPVDRGAITASDAARAGHASLDELFGELDARGDAQIWRIELHWAGDDPRRLLREQADLDGAELERLRARLERFDSASRHGPWTRATLELIAARPETRAEDLAASVGREKLPFKRDVRKLKELGLTESLLVGYRLSPRGRAVLAALGAGERQQ
jgi:hypothetical protein